MQKNTLKLENFIKIHRKTATFVTICVRACDDVSKQRLKNGPFWMGS